MKTNGNPTSNSTPRCALTAAVHLAQSTARRIAIFTWEDTPSGHDVALAVARSLSKETDQSACVIRYEGLLPLRESPVDGIDSIRLPEAGTATRQDDQADLLEPYFYQVIAAPPLHFWQPLLQDQRPVLSAGADAHVLVLGQNGLTRSGLKKIQTFARLSGFTWTAIVDASELEGTQQ
jgi:hypothetical protein